MLFGKSELAKQVERKKLGNSYLPVYSQDYQNGHVWTGKILFGEDTTAMNLVLDTASDWLIVQGSDCTNCKGNKYDIGPS